MRTRSILFGSLVAGLLVASLATGAGAQSASPGESPMSGGLADTDWLLGSLGAHPSPAARTPTCSSRTPRRAGSPAATASSRATPAMGVEPHLRPGRHDHDGLRRRDEHVRAVVPRGAGHGGQLHHWRRRRPHARGCRRESRADLQPAGALPRSRDRGTSPMSTTETAGSRQFRTGSGPRSASTPTAPSRASAAAIASAAATASTELGHDRPADVDDDVLRRRDRRLRGPAA